MLPIASQSHHITRSLRLHAAHLVTEGPSPPPLLTPTVPQVVAHLVVIVKVHRTLNGIEREAYSRQLIVAELQLQLVCNGRCRDAARKAQRLVSRDRKHDPRTL